MTLLTKNSSGNYVYGGSKVGNFVLNKFGNMKGQSSGPYSHQKSQIHVKCSELYNNFLERSRDPTQSISANSSVISTTSRLAKAKSGVIEIIKTILFIAQRGLPLRGHTDYGELDFRTIFQKNEGLFRDLLKLQITSGCTVLKNHLKNCPGNASYTSKRIQNEILVVIADMIVKKIAKIARRAEFYTLIIDETQDIASIEQISLSIRVFHEGRCEEYFLGFFDCYDELKKFQSLDQFSLNGEAIAKIVLALLKRVGLSKKQMAFLATDGAPSLAGVKKGAISFLKEKIPHLTNLICSNHNLNNSIKQGLDFSAMSETLSLAQKIISFFSDAKRQSILLNAINDGKHAEKLKKFCITRWSEQYKSVSSVISNIEVIMISLNSMLTNPSLVLRQSARDLMNQIRAPDALFPLLVARKMLSITNPLVKMLQSQSIDYLSALELMKNTISQLEEVKESQQEFNSIFCENKLLSSKLSSYSNRFQISPDYQLTLRKDIYEPTFSRLINDFKERTGKNEKKLSKLLTFVTRPEAIDADECYDLMNTYSPLFQLENVGHSAESLMSEHALFWKCNPSVNSIHVMCELSENFTILNKVFRLLATATSSTATAERTFSALRRIKTFNRATMCEERISAIAVSSFNFQLSPTPEEIFAEFVNSSKRRFDLD